MLLVQSQSQTWVFKPGNTKGNVAFPFDISELNKESADVLGWLLLVITECFLWF